MKKFYQFLVRGITKLILNSRIKNPHQLTYWHTNLLTTVIPQNPFSPTVFEVYKFQKPLWAYLGMPDHTHLKLHDQFAALIDMKLHAQYQPYTSISFWDIKVLKASFGMLDHTHLNINDQFITLIDMALHAQN